MKHVSILIPQGHSSIVNIGGTLQMLSWVNDYLLETGKAPMFDLHMVGLKAGSVSCGGPFSTQADATIENVHRTDLIIIPAIHGDFELNREQNEGFTHWIIDRYKEGAEIVSLCVASFFLASTGLLDGKSCSTHWQFANEFRDKFPKANLKDERILTDSDGIYTSGGAYSFTNLIIYLIEKFAGRDIAVMAAKGFMIDIDRLSQSPFSIFSGQKSHGDADVLKAQDFIEQNYALKITVNDLSESMALNRRTFERRFKKATANSVVEYHQRVKVEAAKKELERGRKTVNEVMYEVGYSDPKAFRDVFRKFTNMTPNDYTRKYGKVALES